MTLKKLFFIALMICWTLAAFAQTPTKPRLAILPFSGGSGGDGETIATLFSNYMRERDAFTIVLRTNAVNALIAEQNFQMSGYTDSDTIAGLGKMLNADFVVSGHIRRLGNRNLILTTIINVETFEQLAGDYSLYEGSIVNARSLLPEIARKMIDASLRDTTSLPKLAVAPFVIRNRGANAYDAETLSQILAVEITNTGRFAVLPRTTTMQAALKELEFQMSGNTADDGAKKMGEAINAEYVLSAELLGLDSQNMFSAQIINVKEGSLLAGDIRDYQAIDDGIVLMKELALLLTNRAQAQAVIAAREREVRIRERGDARAAFFADPARLWSVGASVGTSFADPFVTGTLRATIAPFRHSFLELGCDAGFISNVEGVTSFYSIYPFAHYAFYMPFLDWLDWYAGAGGGFMIAEYQVADISVSRNIFAADVVVGVNLLNFLNVSYTLQTDFATVSSKVSVGYFYRFK